MAERDERDVSPASTTAPDSRAAAAADEVLGQLSLVGALPADVRQCIVARATGDPTAIEGVVPGDEATWSPVVDLVAGCQHEVVAAPQFAEEQQRAHGGSLSDAVLGCVRDGYAELGRDVAAAAAAESISPDGAGSALDLIDGLLEDCGVA